MEKNTVELHATETILQRGVRVKVRAPLLLRIFGLKTVSLTLRVPTAGALSRMGRWYLMCQLPLEKLEGISLEEALLFKVKYGRFIYNALACLFLGNRMLTRLFMKPFSRWLMESMSAAEALTLLQLVILHGGLEDFMNTTRLIRGKMLTPPKKSGPMTKRS